MWNSERFYRERDRRTEAYIRTKGRPPRPVDLVWGEEAATSEWGQLSILSTVNMLARFSRAGRLQGPDARMLIQSPFGGVGLRDAVETTARAIDPYGDWSFGDPAGSSFTLGIGQVPESATFYGRADGWAAVVGSTPPIKSSSGSRRSDVLGAGLCACLLSANAFKASFGLDQDPFVGKLSLWSMGLDGDSGPELPIELDLGRVLIAGAGAVASGFAYWSRFLPFKAHWDVVDHDRIELHNTNRSLLFLPSDAGWGGSDRRQKAAVMAGFLTDATPFLGRVDQILGRDQRWDLILVLANDYRARTWIQSVKPALGLAATTGADWTTQSFRYRPGRDRCLVCDFPETGLPQLDCATAPIRPSDVADEADSPDAALPFLSAAAGLMLSADLAKLSMGELAASRWHVATWDWFRGIGRPTQFAQSCDSECTRWGSPSVRLKVNRGTRWFDLDPEANRPE